MAQKILVIDDSPAAARLTENVIAQHFPGCDVLTASRGSEGFERISFASPDMVLLNDALPDMDTDAVLARLGADPLAAQTPIVLMVEPSRAGDLNGRHANLARVLSKPISPESLLEAVTSVLGAKPSARRVLPTRGGIVFSGHTGFIPLRQALAMAQSDRLSGVLRFPMGRHPIELWMNAGRFLFATTRNFHLYCGGSTVILSATNLGLILEGQVNQQVTGCPLFLFLAARNGFPHDDVAHITRDHGQRLFSQLFTAGRVTFEFEATDRVPDYVRNFPPSAEDADNWILGALRHVKFEQIPPAQRPDPNGSPAYTRRGYELVQKLRLNEVEVRFAGAINGTDPLQAIAAKLGISLGDALLIVFRFQSLDIIDFWNAGVLSLPGAAS
jgi:CheY-like chemotaxis protein